MHIVQPRERGRVLKLAVATVIAASVSLTLQVIGLGMREALSLPTATLAILSTALVGIAATLLLWRNIEVFNGIGHLAFTDELTELPNRRRFQQKLNEELDAARLAGRECAVLYLDLDRFKQINDTYGHEAGDAVIAQFAARVTRNIRKRDFAARLGGDEFAVILTDSPSVGEVDKIARRILAAMRKPMHFDGKHIHASVSIGATHLDAACLEPRQALQRADFALFRAKESGRNNLQIFSHDMEERIRDRNALASDLREAVVNEHFQVCYQPLVSHETGAVLGVEAFVRWFHPERGAVPPMRFIPVAEEIGLIEPLGELILRRACADLLDLRPLKLAVNISALQFGQRGFVETVRSVLEQTGFEPQRLELEITEQVFRNDPARTRETIARLRTLGVRIALDDFGTGLSSMAYLRDFPLDRIKIDRSFTREIGQSDKSLSLVAHMIELGGALGLSVTVEGIETSGQLELLRSRGLTEMQGHLFSQPLTLSELQCLDLGGSTGDRASRPAPRNDPFARSLAG